jgi:hypothetical protein
VRQRRIYLAIAVTALLAATVFAQKPIQTGTISGTVTQADGSPQANARVYFQPSDGSVPHVVQTDATGHFKFQKIKIGLYDVRAQANGAWSDVHRNVNVRANQSVTIDLQLKPASTEKPATP